MARRLAERFCPDTGVPLRVGELWPPRLFVHAVAARPREATHAVSLWFRHALRAAVDVTVDSADLPAVDSEGREIVGLTVRAVSAQVAPAPERVEPRAPGEPAPHAVRLALTLEWSPRFAADIQAVDWVRMPLLVTLADGKTERVFQWHIYLTPDQAEPPGARSAYDDLPHFRWVDAGVEPVTPPGVAPTWIELPTPLTNARLQPACWVQPARDLDPAPRTGPEDTALVAVYPAEPAVPAGVEAVGWNGAVGAHDPRPRVQALAVRSHPGAAGWQTGLEYWDAGAEGVDGAVARDVLTPLDAPRGCLWPQVQAAVEQPLVLYDLVRAEQSGHRPAARDVRVNFRIVAHPHAAAVQLDSGAVRLGEVEVGRWEDGPIALHPGQRANLRCTVDLAAFRSAGDGRVELSLQFGGRPTRGVVYSRCRFATSNGPTVQLMRSRAAFPGGVRTPWLVIDLGTAGTSAAVAFLDGFVPRVINVQFDSGPVTPSAVPLSPALGGVFTLADEPDEDGLVATLVKLGLRYGDGAHPGCPDHIAATEVARFFLKRLLLEIKARVGWFPLHVADVLVSFPPRLAAMPRFVRSLRDTFASVLGEVLWTAGSRRLSFREEALLAAMPGLYQDLQTRPVPPRHARLYWVMDFGAGSTDVCGLRVDATERGEEHRVVGLTYPQRLPHHISGNDVTGSFYVAILGHLADAGLRGRFLLPDAPLPAGKMSATALSNQAAVWTLAEAVKVLGAAERAVSLRQIAQDGPRSRLRAVDGTVSSLVAVLSESASALGDLTAATLYAEVLGEEEAKSLRLRQGERTFSLGDGQTLRRWVQERRVGPDDLVSDDGVTWTPLRARATLRGLFQDAEALGVDVTQDVPTDGWERWVFPSSRPGIPPAPPVLGRDIRRFVATSRAALDRALASMPGVEQTEVVVLISGGASRFAPLAEAVRAGLPGRVEVLDQDWVRRNYGSTGQIDPGADRETMVVNGGGLFALLHSNPEASHLSLALDSLLMEVPVYLQAASAARPWRITDRLQLKAGDYLPLASPVGLPALYPGAADEPPPRALPVDTPLTGELQLVVEGLPEDRGWEPYVVIARGTASRRGGRRARTLPETRLHTLESDFVLTPLTLHTDVRFARVLPRLPLLEPPRDE